MGCNAYNPAKFAQEIENAKPIDLSKYVKPKHGLGRTFGDLMSENQDVRSAIFEPLFEITRNHGNEE